MLTPIAQIFAAKDDIMLRSYLESLRAWYDTEQASFREHWRTLANFMLPRSPRFNYTETDQGQRKDFSLIDNCATLGLRTLGSGLLSQMSSPTRLWFNMLMEDDVLNEHEDVKDWLEEAGGIVRKTFIKSNFYQTLHNAYREEGCFGTTAFEMLEDEDDDIRCFPWPIGSYYLSLGADLRVDAAMRIVQMTARQLVDKYEIGNVSNTIRTYVESNAGGMKEKWWPVVKFICKNKYFGVKSFESATLPWASFHYEMATLNDQPSADRKLGILRRGGYNEFPVIAGRWDVTGEDVYGNSPGMDCLGDCMALQLQQKRKQQAIDKKVNPPMIANPSLMGLKLSTLPGDVTFAETREGAPGFRPAFQVQYELAEAQADIRETQARIRAALYTDLFLMLATSDRREVTAEEIRAKVEEKMTVLGPVLERNNDEILKPAVLRCFAILYRKRKIPPIPEVLRGKPFKVQFSSILAQVQQMLGLANLDRFQAFIGSQVAANPAVLDNVDMDEGVRHAGKLLSMPAKLIRRPEDVQKIREARAKQEQAVNAAAQAQQLAQAGKTLSQTDLGTDNAATRLLANAGQGGL